MDTEPLCPDAELIINQDLKALVKGVKKISLLTKGNVFICKKNDSQVKVNDFEYI